MSCIARDYKRIVLPCQMVILDFWQIIISVNEEKIMDDILKENGKISLLKKIINEEKERLILVNIDPDNLLVSWIPGKYTRTCYKQ